MGLDAYSYTGVCGVLQSDFREQSVHKPASNGADFTFDPFYRINYVSIVKLYDALIDSLTFTLPIFTLP